MTWTPNRRLAAIAVVVFALDQLAKLLVLRNIVPTEEHEIVPGFFKLVHWENSGAAWSLFHDRNAWLAVVSIAALIGLYFWRHHFYMHLPAGQVSLGLVFGGITGNLFDRLHYHHQVIDFLRFYMIRHSGQEIGFPAFNIADSAICVGVGLLILVSWKYEEDPDHKTPQRNESVPDAFRADR